MKRNLCKWRFPAIGALAIGILAFSAYSAAGDRAAQRDKGKSVDARQASATEVAPLPNAGIARSLNIPVERADRLPVTVLPPVFADGAQGGAADTGLGQAIAYSTEYSGFVAGAWNVDACGPDHVTPGFGGGAFADQMQLANVKGDGTDELDSYTVQWGAFCSFFDQFDGRCTNPNSSCFNICFPSQQAPPSGYYTITTELYDGPPSPGCGAGVPIAGTQCQFTSTNNFSRVQATCNTNKTLLPGNEVWLTMTSDVDDFWMVIGGIPEIGDSPEHGDLFTDSDADGCYDEWSCFTGTNPFGCDAGPPRPPCEWVHIPAAEVNAQVVFSLVPVPPPAGSKHPGNYTIVNGDEAVLSKGGEVVYFDVRVTSFDPKGEGLTLKGAQSAVDHTGYSSGLQGTLTPHFADCSADPGVCATQMGAGSLCVGGKCQAGYIDKGRTDWLFDGAGTVNPVDVSTLDYRWAATLNPFVPCVADFLPEYYFATLVLDVPDDAKGTFTIDLKPFVSSALIDCNNQFIVPVGLKSGKVTVEVGQCCFGLGADEKKAGCIDGVTANQCPNAGLCKGVCEDNTAIQCITDLDCQNQGAAGPCLGGATLGQVCFTVQDKPDGKPLACDTAAGETCVVQGASVLLVGQDCTFPCVECTVDADCDDGVSCTNDACVNFFCENTANDAKCDDGNPCTDDTCDPVNDCQFVNDDTNNCDDGQFCNGAEECQSGSCVVKGKLPCDDNLACTTDTCDEVNDTCSNVKIDCTDADPCTIDSCVEPSGTCSNVLLPSVPDPLCPITGADLNECLALTVDQYTGLPVATAWDAATGCCLCVLCCNDTACDDLQNPCPPCQADLAFDISPSDKPNVNCFAQGEKLTVDIVASETLQPICGGQFVMTYDPSCVAFNSISPGGAPYTFEIEELVDEANGRIFYAVGVDPFGGPGQCTFGGVLATASFTKLGHECSNCNFDFAGEKPQFTYMVNDEGQPICAKPQKSKEIHVNDVLSLDVPADQKVNSDCDAATAMVWWDPPAASSSCFDPACDPTKEKCYEVNLECTGMHESGKDMTALIMAGGGEHPQGRTDYWCTATSKICGDSIDGHWTVTVNDTQALDVEVQLSPIIAGTVERCINFQLFSDCVTPPTEFQQELLFGGIWDFVGHFTEEKKIPKGQWVCITARDQQHSLRACDYLECIDGVYHAAFKGDPFFGGNWLINGNLDGWKKDNPNASIDHIDILDFGTFVAQYGMQLDPNTPCATKHDGPHADINGDGMVNALDFTFILDNFLADSNDCCCPAQIAAEGASAPRVEISVAELRQMGMADLAVADLNGDGLVNQADMTAFLAGQTPTRKAPSRNDRTGSGLGSR